MNQQFVKLLAERQEEAESLLYEITRFKAELRKKVQELKNRVDMAGYRNVSQSFYRERTGLYDDLCSNIRVSEDLLVSVDVSIFPHGWEVWIWPREGKYSELKDLLQELDVPFEEDEGKGGFSHRDSYAYAYDENPGFISSTLQDLIDKLATSREGEG